MTKTRTYKRGKLTITVTSNEPSPETIKRFNKLLNQLVYEKYAGVDTK